jgi:hypothetical protein
VVVPRHPLFGLSKSTNKLRAFEMDVDPSTVVIYLDCDVVVMGDLSDEVRPDVVRAAPDTVQHYSPEDWRTVSAALGIPLPAETMVSASSGERSVPYYNGGVLFLPARYAALLTETWQGVIERMQAVARNHDTPVPWRDQPPLTFALQAAGIPVEPLPPTLNWSCYRSALAPPYQSLPPDPAVLHYHDRMDASGFLIYSHDARQARLMHAFNKARGEVLGTGYGLHRYLIGRVRVRAARTGPYRRVKALVRRRQRRPAAGPPPALVP